APSPLSSCCQGGLFGGELRNALEKHLEGLCEGHRLLQVRQVGGRIEYDQLGAFDLLVDGLRRGERRAHVLGADDDQRRQCDRLQPVGQVERLDGVAAADVADRKSTRLNSSHLVISYAVFCLKKKKK